MDGERCRRELFSDPDHIIYAHDLAGNITFLNEAGERISGYSCEEARRMNIAELVAPELAEQVQKQITRRLRERFGTVFDIDIIAKDGRRVAVEVSMCVVLDNGGPIEIQGIAVPSVLRNQSTSRLKLRCLDEDFIMAKNSCT